jgi:hypothetical protein
MDILPPELAPKNLLRNGFCAVQRIALRRARNFMQRFDFSNRDCIIPKYGSIDFLSALIAVLCFHHSRTKFGFYICRYRSRALDTHRADPAEQRSRQPRGHRAAAWLSSHRAL